MEEIEKIRSLYQKEKLARETFEKENKILKLKISQLTPSKNSQPETEETINEYLNNLNNPETPKYVILNTIKELCKLGNYMRHPEIMRSIYSRAINDNDSEITSIAGNFIIAISPKQQFVKTILSVLRSNVTRDEKKKAAQILEDIITGLCEGDASYTDRMIRHRAALLFYNKAQNLDEVENILKTYVLNESPNKITDDFLTPTTNIPPITNSILPSNKAELSNTVSPLTTNVGSKLTNSTPVVNVITVKEKSEELVEGTKVKILDISREERKHNLIMSYHQKSLRGSVPKRLSLHHEQNFNIRNEIQTATSEAAFNCITLVERLIVEKKSDFIPWLLNLFRYKDIQVRQSVLKGLCMLIPDINLIKALISHCITSFPKQWLESVEFIGVEDALTIVRNMEDKTGLYVWMNSIKDLDEFMNMDEDSRKNIISSINNLLDPDQFDSLICSLDPTRFGEGLRLWNILVHEFVGIKPINNLKPDLGKERLSRIQSAFIVNESAKEYTTVTKKIISGIKNGKKQFTDIPETIISQNSKRLFIKPFDMEDVEAERRENSLEDFKFVLEDLWEILSEGYISEKVSEVEEIIEDGHVILSAVLLDDTVYVVSKFKADPSTIPRKDLVILLEEVKVYCEVTNTLQFPPEWVQIVSDLSYTMPELPSIPPPTTTTNIVGNNKKPVVESSTTNIKRMNSGETKHNTSLVSSGKSRALQRDPLPKYIRNESTSESPLKHKRRPYEPKASKQRSAKHQPLSARPKGHSSKHSKSVKYPKRDDFTRYEPIGEEVPKSLEESFQSEDENIKIPTRKKSSNDHKISSSRRKRVEEEDKSEEKSRGEGNSKQGMKHSGTFGLPKISGVLDSLSPRKLRSDKDSRRKNIKSTMPGSIITMTKDDKLDTENKPRSKSRTEKYTDRSDDMPLEHDTKHGASHPTDNSNIKQELQKSDISDNGMNKSEHRSRSKKSGLKEDTRGNENKLTKKNSSRDVNGDIPVKRISNPDLKLSIVPDTKKRKLVKSKSEKFLKNVIENKKDETPLESKKVVKKKSTRRHQHFPRENHAKKLLSSSYVRHDRKIRRSVSLNSLTMETSIILKNEEIQQPQQQPQPQPQLFPPFIPPQSPLPTTSNTRKRSSSVKGYVDERMEENSKKNIPEVVVRGNLDGYVGSIVKFEIILKYPNHEYTSSKLSLKIDGASSDIKAQIIDQGDGTYHIEFIPTKEGPHIISIYEHMKLLKKVKSVIRGLIEYDRW